MAETDKALIEVQAELAELEGRRRNLVARRSRLVRSLIEAQGWKFVARMLGVGHSRVYALSARKPTTRDAERRGTGNPTEHPAAHNI